MSGWIDRYRGGEHRQVWAEMTSLGGDLRADAEKLEEARAVTRETMVRARHNVERLIGALTALGYEFDSDEPLVPPSPDTAARLDVLEAEIGSMPLALRGWFEEVGQVNLVGRDPDGSVEYEDPLVVEAPVDYIRWEYAQWLEDPEHGSEPFEIPVAPDHLHKAGVSGGSPYRIAVPNLGADGTLLGEPQQTTFTNYLRLAFGMVGTRGWHQEPAPAPPLDWAFPDEAPPQWLLDVSDQLLPL